MILTPEYFNVDAAISNVNNDSPDNTLLGNATSTREYIAVYEREALILALGYKLYKEFLAQFDYEASTGMHTIKSAADQKWKNLLTGKEYTVNGETYNYRGLTYVELMATDLKRSPLTYYIRAMYIQKTEAPLTGIGHAVQESENSERVPATVEYVENYNNWVTAMQGTNASHEVSLMQFIYDINALTPDTYEDFKPTALQYKNRYGF